MPHPRLRMAAYSRTAPASHSHQMNSRQKSQTRKQHSGFVTRTGCCKALSLLACLALLNCFDTPAPWARDNPATYMPIPPARPKTGTPRPPPKPRPSKPADTAAAKPEKTGKTQHARHPLEEPGTLQRRRPAIHHCYRRWLAMKSRNETAGIMWREFSRTCIGKFLSQSN